MFEENYLFHVPEQKRIKVILDSDVRNEVDDQFAIMHALMTPKFDVRGVIAAHFGHDRIQNSMEASYEELKQVLRHAGLEGKVRIAKGSQRALQVKEKGYFDQKNLYLQGILITATDIEKIEFDKAVLSLEKYRGGLAAVFPKYELTLVDNDYWDLKVLSMAIS